MLDSIVTAITPYLVQLIFMGIIAILGMGFKWLKDKDSLTKISIVNFALNSIHNVVVDIAESTKQEVLEGKPDKLDRELIEKIKTIASKKAKKEIPDLLQNLSGAAKDELDDLIKDWIESYLGKSD